MNRSELFIPCRGERLAVWHYQAAGEPPRPCVIMAPGFGLTRDARLPAYAERFCTAGFDVVLFDYRHFGSSTGEPRQLLSFRRQLEDWAAVVDYCRSQPRIDAARLVLWGTSFSGGHVIVTAARDPRIAAVIAQVPFVDALAVVRALGPAAVLRLTVAGMRDLWRQAVRREPHRVPLAGERGEPAALPLPGAKQGYRELVGGDPAWSETVCARVFLWLPLYRPVRFAGRVRCPLLIQVAEDDIITPIAPALRTAKRAPHGISQTYPGGHFDLYFGETFEKALAGQITFLRRAVGLSQGHG